MTIQMRPGYLAVIAVKSAQIAERDRRARHLMRHAPFLFQASAPLPTLKAR